jgi:hypothetical protein
MNRSTTVRAPDEVCLKAIRRRVRQHANESTLAAHQAINVNPLTVADARGGFRPASNRIVADDGLDSAIERD